MSPNGKSHRATRNASAGQRRTRGSASVAQYGGVFKSRSDLVSRVDATTDDEDIVEDDDDDDTSTLIFPNAFDEAQIDAVMDTEPDETDDEDLTDGEASTDTLSATYESDEGASGDEWTSQAPTDGEVVNHVLFGSATGRDATEDESYNRPTDDGDDAAPAVRDEAGQDGLKAAVATKGKDFGDAVVALRAFSNNTRSGRVSKRRHIGKQAHRKVSK